jgi:galactitol-specific phosphotransferase system IIC component
MCSVEQIKDWNKMPNWTKNKVIGWAMVLIPITLFLAGYVASSENPLANLITLVVVLAAIACMGKGIFIVLGD